LAKETIDMPEVNATEAFGKAARGLALAATGVGAPAGVILSVAIVKDLAETAGLVVISTVAATAAYNSGRNLLSSTNAEKRLPQNTGRNFRERVTKLLGEPPEGRKAYQAHHAFPQTQEFDRFFKGVGLDKHDAKFGSWVETSQHRKEAAAYNKKWRDFISNNPEASIQEVINEGKRIMKLFGYKINF
jgi:hypothetical protein